MAVLLTYTNELSKVPFGKQVTPEEIAEILCVPLEGLGIASSEFAIMAYSLFNMDDKQYNWAASSYMNRNVYGNAYFFSGSEFDQDTELGSYVTPMNSMMPPSDFDDAFIISMNVGFKKMKEIEETVSKHGIDYILPSSKTIKLDLEKLYGKLEDAKSKESAYSEEGDLDRQGMLDNLLGKISPKFTEEEMTRVIDKTYETLERHRDCVIDPENFVLFRDDNVSVVFDPEKANRTICLMMGHYLDREEYEKCAVLRDIKLKRPDVVRSV